MTQIGISLNPDVMICVHVLDELRKNKGYCPSKLIRSDNSECMCKEFRDKLTSGPCRCGLYIKEVVNTDETD